MEQETPVEKKSGGVKLRSDEEVRIPPTHFVTLQT